MRGCGISKKPSMLAKLFSGKVECAWWSKKNYETKKYWRAYQKGDIGHTLLGMNQGVGQMAGTSFWNFSLAVAFIFLIIFWIVS